MTRKLDGRHPEGRAGAAPFRLCLLGRFELFAGKEPVVLPGPTQRLLALLGLVDSRPVLRSHVAGTLWPEASEAAARSNTRSALWRLASLRAVLIEVRPDELRLSPAVSVDLQRNRSLALGVLDRSLDGAGLTPRDFATDLLPYWSDLWLEPERESYRQLRLHALEALSSRLLLTGHFGRAVEAALMAVSASPIRESAHRALINALVAEGNRGEALRYYRRLGTLLETEFGVGPSFRMEDVLDQVAG